MYQSNQWYTILELQGEKDDFKLGGFRGEIQMDQMFSDASLTESCVNPSSLKNFDWIVVRIKGSLLPRKNYIILHQPEIGYETNKKKNRCGLFLYIYSKCSWVCQKTMNRMCLRNVSNYL